MLRTAQELILPMGEASRKRCVCPYRRANLYLQSKTGSTIPSAPGGFLAFKRFPVQMENTASSSTGTSSFGRSSWFQSRVERGMS